MALRSYVQAIADVGIMKLLQESIRQSDNDMSALPFGFNAAMHAQVFRALLKLCPGAMRHLALDLVFEIAENTPDTWFNDRLFLLDDIYALDDLVEHHLPLMKELPPAKWRMVVGRCFENSWYRYQMRKLGNQVNFWGLGLCPLWILLGLPLVPLIRGLVPFAIVLGILLGPIIRRMAWGFGNPFYDTTRKFIKRVHLMASAALAFSLSVVCLTVCGFLHGFQGETRAIEGLFIAFWIYVGLLITFCLCARRKDFFFRNRYLVSVVTGGESDTLSYSEFEALLDPLIPGESRAEENL